MLIKGEFEVSLLPQQDNAAPAGRMLIEKQYQGALQGEGCGQMLSKRLENGTALYVAIEEFKGSLSGQTGGFTLVHKGLMSTEQQNLEIFILEGSGFGELEGISGTMAIKMEEGKHFYELDYTL